MTLWRDKEFFERHAEESNRELARRYGGDESSWRRWRKKLDIASAPEKLRVDIKKESVVLNSEMNTIICLPDIHVPYHDNEAVNCALEFIAVNQPDEVIIGGDFLDMYSISKYVKVTAPDYSINREIDEGNALLDRLQEAAGDAKITYIQGNHEFRLNTYLAVRAPEIIDIEYLSIPQFLKLSERGIEYVSSDTRTAFVVRGSVAIGHFDKVAKHSAYTAKSLVEDNFNSIIQFHTHRLGAYYKTTIAGDLVGIEGGCLCDLDPTYVQSPNWQQGIVLYERMGDIENITQVPIRKGRILFNGRVYDGSNRK